MKSFVKFIAALMCVVTLASCGGPELLSIMPVYVGGTVDSTYYEFSKDDFYVLANYDNGVDEVITDYEFEVKGMENGYYVISFVYKDVDNETYVPIEVDIYPSDFRDNEETGATEETEHSH